MYQPIETRENRTGYSAFLQEQREIGPKLWTPYRQEFFSLNPELAVYELHSPRMRYLTSEEQKNFARALRRSVTVLHVARQS